VLDIAANSNTRLYPAGHAEIDAAQ
jgi:hypothetical protein